MSRFNIALLPVEETLQEIFANLAQRHLSTVSDQYILGSQALAHVTLCQFEADTEAVAGEAFAALPNKQEQSLRLGKLATRAGEGDDAGRTWVQFPVEKTATLAAQQQACFEHLMARGLKAFNHPQTYSPHLTLARITGALSEVLSEDPPVTEPIPVRLALGLSAPVGVYIGTLQLG